MKPASGLNTKRLVAVSAAFTLLVLVSSCGGGGRGILNLDRPTATAPASPGQPPANAARPAGRPLFASPTGGTPLDWAASLVKSVAPGDTNYDHKGTVTWQGVAGATKATSHTDCSGLINALLTQADGLTARDFKTWLGSERPLAKDYFAAIEKERGFTKIASVSQVRPGDLIAVRYLNSAPGDDTGHIMLVAGRPNPHEASKPLEAKTAQWDVNVIDSADSGHGPTDTRSLDKGKSRPGLGQGTLRIYADEAGAIVGYTWSDLADSQFFATRDRPVVVGRLDPTFVATQGGNKTLDSRSEQTARMRFGAQ